jgi:hypothetical protein
MPPKRNKRRKCLATGKIANQTDRQGMRDYFAANNFGLFDDNWIFERLLEAASADYENDVAHVVSKVLIRRLKKELRKKKQ